MGAFALGVIVTAIVVAILLMGGGDDNKDSAQGSTTRTPVSTGTPGTGTPSTPLVTPGTLTGSFTRPADAVAAYVQQRLSETYAGPCPSAGQTETGVCSRSLYESDQLATYFLERAGTPSVVGEAVLTVQTGGTWSLDFIPQPAPAAALAVGSNAVVFGAGDCLNFRSAAGTSAAPTPSSCQLDGTKAQVIEGPTQADGVTWWNLQGYGWASAQYLVAAP